MKPRFVSASFHPAIACEQATEIRKLFCLRQWLIPNPESSPSFSIWEPWPQTQKRRLSSHLLHTLLQTALAESLPEEPNRALSLARNKYATLRFTNQTCSSPCLCLKILFEDKQERREARGSPGQVQLNPKRSLILYHECGHSSFYIDWIECKNYPSNTSHKMYNGTQC